MDGHLVWIHHNIYTALPEVFIAHHIHIFSNAYKNLFLETGKNRNGKPIEKTLSRQNKCQSGMLAAERVFSLKQSGACPKWPAVGWSQRFRPSLELWRVVPTYYTQLDTLFLFLRVLQCTLPYIFSIKCWVICLIKDEAHLFILISYLPFTKRFKGWLQE